MSSTSPPIRPDPSGVDPAASVGRNRLLSLDAFRGVTIAAMVLVNNPGSWDHVYSPLLHAEWNGWTPTDLIFPFFLFIVGVSLSLSFGSKEGTATSALLRRVVRRSAILFGLGIFMAAFPRFDLLHVRVPGVLQRIAICYLAASILVLYAGTKTRWWTIAILLLGYWALVGADLSVEGNLAARLDRYFLSGHLWRGTWDPEGLLSTLPAIATTLFGVLAGERLRAEASGHEIAARLYTAGFVLLLGGLAWGAWFPVNKNLWTSSYVLFTAGAALLAFALLYWVVDVRKRRAWVSPAVALGRNAIAVFVLSGLVAKSLILARVAGEDGTPVSLYTLVYEKAFASWAGPFGGSLVFALCAVAFWWGVTLVLDRKRIYITV